MSYIEYLGISEHLPKNIKYFKEDLLETVVSTYEECKEIKEIISTSIDCKVNFIRLVNTQVRVSNEGQRLSGKKILVDVSLSYRIKYLSKEEENYIYILKANNTKAMYIVVPQEINNNSVEELIRKKKISIEPYVEDLYVRIENTYKIYIRTLLLIDLNIKKYYS